jgi:GTP pyrophosphokinase
MPDTGQMAAALSRTRELEEILTELVPDPDILAAARLYPLAAAGLLDEKTIQDACGVQTARQVSELVRLGSFGLPEQWRPGKPLPSAQAETLRKMLLAIVADVRLVTVRLADQLQRMRSAKTLPEVRQHRVAMETRVIFAPLANRLGIWYLKWELEDLSFRFLEPATYRDIAVGLQERREERERRITEVIEWLKTRLDAEGIKADVEGRPKHIYSIWRKMQRKDVGLNEIFDMSAVRILVDSISDCYTVLGMVHGHWAYIRGEFDDYIANPKGNFYRSLHTAVIGPDERPLEVQIRTWEMHEHAEKGVAAHWRYKEGGATDPAFEKKINWLRELLEPSGESENDREFVERLRAEIFEDRVYAVTPDGDVVDLPAGATPLDFAYHVHTEVGHHCRGARINGRIVPLTYKLANADKVDIITSRSAQPSRDWLIPQRGYLASPRSRSKVRSWFRRLDKDVNRRQGKAMLEKELQKLGVRPDLVELAEQFKLARSEQLFLAIGAGDITLAAITHAIERARPVADELPTGIVSRRHARRARQAEGIIVSGVGELMTHMARCCRPVPPEPIGGYITQGRGVSVHRLDCRNLLRLQTDYPQRSIAVDWGTPPESGFIVDVRVEAYDRQGLLRDISMLLADQNLDILANTTRTDKSSHTAIIEMTLSITGLDQLSRILHKIGSLSNVYSVERRG